MFKRMFQFSSNENDAPVAGGDSPTIRTPGLVKLSSALQREAETAAKGVSGLSAVVPPVREAFDEVYADAGVKDRPYTILKVADMLGSRHLADMTIDAKRNSLMMALDAAGVEIGELLQDAVNRNRALDEYEEKRRQLVHNFEAAKTEENEKLRAELERLTSQYTSRMQANTGSAVEEQDKFRTWQKRKQQESQRITDAATFCVPQGNNPHGGASLTAVLERVAVLRR